jgi:hypothetical protein
MASNEIFIHKGELIVAKDQPEPDASRWKFTGKYWAKGTPLERRTTAARGTHKVYQDLLPGMLKEQQKQETKYMKGVIGNLAGNVETLRFNNESNNNEGKGMKKIDHKFVQMVINSKSANNIPYGEKLSRGLMNSDIPNIKAYAIKRSEEGAPVNAIVQELTHMRNTDLAAAIGMSHTRPKLVIPNMAPSKKTKSKKAALVAMTNNIEGGNYRKHRKTHKRRNTRK